MLGISLQERFKLISEAYQVLSDTEQRAAFDRFGKAGRLMAGASVGLSGQPFCFTSAEDGMRGPGSSGHNAPTLLLIG